MMNDNENNSILPETRSPEQIKWDTLRPYLLDPREDYPEPYTMLEFNGVPFSKIGGLAAISGQKKNGKSFVLTQLMAAILGCGNERTKQYLPGLTVPDRTIEYLGHLPKVLYVDTEMEKLSSAKVLRRVHWLCGWDMKQPNDRFAVLWLKSMPKDDNVKPYNKRFELIKIAIDAIQPDVVFVDGLRDLISSINDEEAGTTILDYFGSIAEERNLSSKSKEQPIYDDLRSIREWIEQAKGQFEWPMSRSQIKKQVFGDIGGVKNDGRQQADLMAAINGGFLEETTLKSGGHYMLQPPEDLPF